MTEEGNLGEYAQARQDQQQTVERRLGKVTMIITQRTSVMVRLKDLQQQVRTCEVCRLCTPCMIRPSSCLLQLWEARNEQLTKFLAVVEPTEYHYGLYAGSLQSSTSRRTTGPRGMTRASVGTALVSSESSGSDDETPAQVTTEQTSEPLDARSYVARELQNADKLAKDIAAQYESVKLKRLHLGPKIAQAEGDFQVTKSAHVKKKLAKLKNDEKKLSNRLNALSALLAKKEAAADLIRNRINAGEEAVQAWYSLHVRATAETQAIAKNKRRDDKMKRKAEAKIKREKYLRGQACSRA